MGCLVLVVAVLVLVVFWKQIVELVLVGAGLALCYAVPACRDNIVPLIRSLGDAFVADPIKTLAWIAIAFFGLYWVANYLAMVLYRRLAPAHLKSQLPTWSDFKSELKRISRNG